jgi:lysozyme
MKSRHQLSRAAVELIKRFEGYRRASAPLGDGRYTIGYGHSKTARADVEIDERDAEALLIYDLLAVTSAVNDLTFTPLTQNQFDALVCFAFNIGLDNFKGSSVLRRVNEGNLLQAAAAIEMWRKSEFEGERIVVDALVRRRAAEKALFLTPTDGFIPAPSPVLPPRADYELAAGGAREQAHRLVTPLDGPSTQPKSEGSEPVAPVPTENASPVAIAAEALSARLRAIEPDKATPPAAEIAAPAEPAEEAALTPVHEPEAVFVPLDVDAAHEAQEVDGPSLMLSPPEPQDAELEPLAEAPEPANEVDQNTAPLPFDEPDEPEEAEEPKALDEEAPFTLASHTGGVERREPTSYMRQRASRFDHMDWPMLASPAALVGLFIAGLGLIAFALVWGASVIPGGAMAAIAWVIGLIGVAAIVTAFYLFVTRIGADES